MSDIKARITALAEAASAAGMPAATEQQANFIVSLMARKELSVKLFDPFCLAVLAFWGWAVHQVARERRARR